MSTESKTAANAVKPVSVPDIISQKGKTPIVCLTAYSTPQAEIVDEHCDLVLSGTVWPWSCTACHPRLVPHLR